MDRGWQIPNPLLDMILGTETACVLECCGVNALDINEPNVAGWVSVAGIASARLALEQIDVLMQKVQITGLPISGMKVHHVFKVNESVSWLAEWRGVLANVLQPCGGTVATCR